MHVLLLSTGRLY